MLTKYLSSPREIKPAVSCGSDCNKINPSNPRHNEARTINPLPLISVSPLMDKGSPLIEPIPTRSPLEIEIEKQYKFDENRQNYIAQMVDEMFEDEDNEAIESSHPQICNECHRLKTHLNDEREKYIETLEENERMKNDIHIISNKLEESNAQMEVLKKQLNKYQNALNIINYWLKNDKSAFKGQEEKEEEEEDEDDSETDIESEDTTNVSVFEMMLDEDSLSDILSDIFPEESESYHEDSNYDVDDGIGLEIADDESYQFVNHCRSIYINRNELTPSLIEPLMEVCNRSIVALYETKYIFANFIHKYEGILKRFNEIQISILGAQKSPNYCKYDAIYKLLVKNVINARFDSQFVIKMYHKPLYYTFYKSTELIKDETEEFEIDSDNKIYGVQDIINSILI